MKICACGIAAADCEYHKPDMLVYDLGETTVYFPSGADAGEVGFTLFAEDGANGLGKCLGTWIFDGKDWIQE